MSYESTEFDNFIKTNYTPEEISAFRTRKVKRCNDRLADHKITTEEHLVEMIRINQSFPGKD